MPRMWGRRRKVEQRTLAPATLPGPTGFPVSQPSPANATSIADAFACIRCLSDAAASVPLFAYRELSDGSRTRAGASTRIVDLLRRPAPGQTMANLIGTLVAHLNLYGNAYVGKYRQGGIVTQLGALQPDTIQVEVNDGEPTFWYSPPYTGDPWQQLTLADVIPIMGMSVDGLQGLSPIRQAANALTLSAQLTAHAAAFFDNDARPTGILRLNRFGDTDAQVAELKDAFEANHLGHPHRIAVVAGDVSFEQLSMPLDDAQFLEQRKLSAVEVARIFRVPPRMIAADPGYSLTYTNSEWEGIQFVTYALRPWLVGIEQAFTSDPDLCAGSLYVEFHLDALLRADTKTRADVYTAALNPQTGWMTRAEVRQRENLEAEPPTAVASSPAQLQAVDNAA